MPVPKSLVAQLLVYAATPAERRDALTHWRLEDVAERQLGWLLQGGMGPLLHYATREQPDAVPGAWRERLSSEEVTARVRHADRIDATCEVIDLCTQHRVPVTLLKGISTSEQYYPTPHLRPMSDVDVLVPAGSYRRVQSLLERAGYRRNESHPDDDEQHHLPPLRHPRFGVWIEVHRRLFPAANQMSTGRVFSADSIDANIASSTFHGRTVRQLGAEIQLIYLAASWMSDLKFGFRPSFLASIFDTTLLLSRVKPDWAKLVALTGNSMPTASLHVLVAYLASRGWADIPRDVLRALAARQDLVGAIQLRIIHAALDRHLIVGRPWRHRFPPPVAGRYNLRRQWAKRVLRRPSV